MRSVLRCWRGSRCVWGDCDGEEMIKKTRNGLLGRELGWNVGLVISMICQ